ncbi:unnamed protein product, partial [Candidula unifasciata]
VGSILAVVKAISAAPVTYSIVPGFASGPTEPALFSVDEAGQLRLLRRLDRETASSHTLFIRAETDTTPPLVDYMEINIQVRDVNDNMPLFTCSPYIVTIPEDAEPQHSIIQLQASDRDHEAQPLSFSFSQGMSDMASIFSINPVTGWIVLLTQLDREKQDFYNLT